MTRTMKDKTWKGLPAMRSILAMPIIIALMVFPVSLCAESTVPQEESQGESQLPLMIAQVQPESMKEETVNDDADVLDDLEDLEEGEEALEEETVSIADPLQPWNRMWYHFNDKVYFWMF